MIATEYGWTIDQILSLTIDQLNLLILRIGERYKKDLVNQSISMRMAIISALSKEGSEAFEKVVDEVFYENLIIQAVSPSQLSKFGLKEIK